MTRRERLEFLGVGFDPMYASDAIEAILDQAGSCAFAYGVTPNVDHLVQLHRRAKDDVLWQAYGNADLCLCDSRILQMLARWSGIDFPVVPGSDLTAQLLERPHSALRSICVIGGSAAMVAKLANRFPYAAWRHHCPPMGVGSNPDAQDCIVRFVEEAACDITFLAIGAPQSELLCHRLAQRRAARGMALCVGASLEFITGAKTRAPRWMQHLKLEWFFRLLSEPRRLAQRYLLDGPDVFRIWYRWRRERSRPDA